MGLGKYTTALIEQHFRLVCDLGDSGFSIVVFRALGRMDLVEAIPEH